ncbi:MAG: hypothetical protein RLO50_10605, partial [Azospirillaceae bacterium]
ALHGAALAKELSIPAVIVPPAPGVTSALGCLLVDIQHDLGFSYIKPVANADAGEIEAEFQALEKEAVERLSKEGVAPEDLVLQRNIDMMYQGQWRSLSVSVGAPFTDLDAAVEAFHREHQRGYNFRRDGAPVELYRLNLRAIGKTPHAELAKHPTGGALPAPKATRMVRFDESESRIDTPVYWRDDLPAGVAFTGPAIVEQLDSTTVIPPGVKVEIDAYMNIIMRIEEA